MGMGSYWFWFCGGMQWGYFFVYLKVLLGRRYPNNNRSRSCCRWSYIGIACPKGK